MHFARRITKATDRQTHTHTHTHTHMHSECVIHIAFHGNSGYANAPRCYYSLYLRCLLLKLFNCMVGLFNPLSPNDRYIGRTAPLTSKRCILCIYSTNTGTEYFKHGIYSPFIYLQNAVCFIILTYLVPVLFTFYIRSVLKFKKIIPVPKG